jgi:hypothetical protein
MANSQSDLLRGIPAIANHLNFETYRQAYYACACGHIPAFKVGNTWCARISTLEEFFSDKERQAISGGV